MESQLGWAILERCKDPLERELERALITRIEGFLRAMGGMFAFMGGHSCPKLTLILLVKIFPYVSLSILLSVRAAKRCTPPGPRWRRPRSGLPDTGATCPPEVGW